MQRGGGPGCLAPGPPCLHGAFSLRTGGPVTSASNRAPPTPCHASGWRYMGQTTLQPERPRRSGRPPHRHQGSARPNKPNRRPVGRLLELVPPWHGLPAPETLLCDERQTPPPPTVRYRKGLLPVDGWPDSFDAKTSNAPHQVTTPELKAGGYVGLPTPAGWMATAY
jgi:hypothetical protein